MLLMSFKWKLLILTFFHQNSFHLLFNFSESIWFKISKFKWTSEAVDDFIWVATDCIIKFTNVGLFYSFYVYSVDVPIK
jgi:hypothetical protein